MRQSDFPAMRALPLFRDVNGTIVEEMLRTAQLQRLSKQVNVLKEGERPRFLHVVTDGIVELFANHDEQETTIDVVRTGTSLVLASVISDTICLYSARTLVASQILMIPAGIVRAFCEREVDFSRAVLNELAERYRGSVRALKNMKLRTSAERLANWILQTFAARGDGQAFELICDKRTLASHLGMTPENFSRNLALLAKYGVRNSGRDIFIDNPATLAQFAKPNVLLDN
jgi:CRP/FNR family transcriptional regulator, transcriptional activator FtrB